MSTVNDGEHADETDRPGRDSWFGVDLASIWAASRNVLEEQAKVIERAVVAGIEGRLGLETQREAWREAHKLAGSLGTFGFDDAGGLARALELALAPTEVLDASQALDLAGLVVDLQIEMARPPAQPPPEPTAWPADDDKPSVLVVDADADRPRRVVEAAARQGLRSALAPTLGAARQLIATAPPDVVVVDDGVDGDDLAAFLAEMACHHPVIATIVLVTHADVSERVRAARGGAGAVLEKPVPPEAVVRSVSRLLEREQAISTVLVVEDDPALSVLIGELLGTKSLAVASLDDAGQLWLALEAVMPDLVLLDNDMAGVDGISLCRAMRSDERWAPMPLVFLSERGSPEVVREMFAAGADDFVSKPVSGDDLVTRVANRIQRSRVQSERPDIDVATGLPDADAFVRDASRLLNLARQDARPAVLAVAELDPPGEPAVAAFGRLLGQVAGDEDTVGAWAGGRVAALLYGTTASEAQVRLEQALPTARAAAGGTASRVSVGLAACPEDGSDFGALGVAAEAALERARRANGDSVEVHEASVRGPAEVVDVLLVDDDEALGTLVVHALSGRGMSVRWLRDGAEAVALLDGLAFRARAVLLDVGLPGLDGLSVLRHLAQSGRLGETRVVMLTVRSNEGEVLEALDLGAFDHVAKPFSLAVLMHRVRRAIEASG